MVISLVSILVKVMPMSRKGNFKDEVILNVFFLLVFLQPTLFSLKGKKKKTLKCKQRCAEEFIGKSKGNYWKIYIPEALRETYFENMNSLGKCVSWRAREGGKESPDQDIGTNL